MKWLTALVIVCLAGCGGGSTQQGTTNPNPTINNTTMQTGQWEFVATPSGGGLPVYVEANLAGSNAAIGSTVFNTALFQFGGTVGGQFSDCANWTTSGQVTSGTFSGTLSSPGSTPPTNQVTYTSTLASTGQAVSNGTYSAPSSTLCGLASGNTTGTFTGSTVPPLNGTFSGPLTGSSAGNDQITIQVTQDPNFGITASGTSVQAGVTTTLSISPAGTSTDNTGGYSNVIGATVQANGTATNVNGSSAFQVFGHFNSSATQLQVVVFGNSGTETGTLTKQ